MARSGDERLKSLSLFAAQVDFEEPGELGLFIDESQVSMLEDVMWGEGFLGQRRTAGASCMLRSQDLVWSRIVREYLMGERPPMSDLMAWNADATRMPYRMHSEYLRKLYFNNDFAQGRWKADGQPIHVEDIRVPVFAVGTVSDYVAPWRSVFKLTHLLDTDFDFLLTSGGHNAGVVSEPVTRAAVTGACVMEAGSPVPIQTTGTRRPPRLRDHGGPIGRDGYGRIPAGKPNRCRREAGLPAIDRSARHQECTSSSHSRKPSQA